MRESDHPVVELRRYRLRPGGRERLIRLFDREFVETQEAAGMRVLGQFRDPADEDGFVWIRAFGTMEARTRALETFYGGPVWAAHRAEAVATMLNSENVLLLAPCPPAGDFAAPARARPAPGAEGAAGGAAGGLLLSAICSLAPGAEAGFAEAFAAAAPAIEAAGARIEATFMRRKAENGFPRLPVREGETVFVWFASFADAAACDAWEAALARDADWTGRLWPDLDRRMWRRMETARLLPTARSLFAR